MRRICLPGARKGLRMGDATVVDSMVRDGLWCACDDQHMGMTGELVAEKHGITREQQDAFALESHRRATMAWREGRFDAEVVPVALPAKKKGAEAVMFARDESVREEAVDDPDAALAALACAAAGVQARGHGDGGQCSGSERCRGCGGGDGGGACGGVGDKPMVRIRAQAMSGVAPRWVMLAPVLGVERVLERAGWSLAEVDLFELNEAFSVQALGVTRELGLGMERVNVNGGAVAIGHPIGASGARVLVTLIHEMMRRDAKKGVAALCLGGGNSVALAVERTGRLGGGASRECVATARAARRGGCGGCRLRLRDAVNGDVGPRRKMSSRCSSAERFRPR